jgi:hypothetical protein
LIHFALRWLSEKGAVARNSQTRYLCHWHTRAHRIHAPRQIRLLMGRDGGQFHSTLRHDRPLPTKILTLASCALEQMLVVSPFGLSRCLCVVRHWPFPPLSSGTPALPAQREKQEPTSPSPYKHVFLSSCPLLLFTIHQSHRTSNSTSIQYPSNRLLLVILLPSQQTPHHHPSRCVTHLLSSLPSLPPCPSTPSSPSLRSAMVRSRLLLRPARPLCPPASPLPPLRLLLSTPSAL